MIRILAHQGGWDEALYVAVPIIVFAFLLRVAKKRADQEAEAESKNETNSPLDPEMPT